MISAPEAQGPGGPLRVLLIEDNPGDARLIGELLRGAASTQPAPRLEVAQRLAEGLARLAEGGVDAVLLDLSLPDSQGLETFARVQEAAPEVPIVVLSGLADETVAVRAVHAGAQDYLVKGRVDGDLLARALRYAVERKALERERAALERHRDEFFSNVSHDLRTPLAAIKASVGVVLANEPPGISPAIHRMLTNIDRAADEMSRLVEDILELSRLQAGRVQLWLARQDLRPLVERAARVVEPLAEQRRQRLELELPPEPVVAWVDAERFKRVLDNLVANANKYGREGGLIHASVAVRDGEARISVSDDGPGVPLEEQGRIFERFYRQSTEATRVRPGSGLGLPIARALVELHGGRLWVESDPERQAGATFRVAVPLSPAPPA